jgi:hypothetical protein
LIASGPLQAPTKKKIHHKIEAALAAALLHHPHRRIALGEWKVVIITMNQHQLEEPQIFGNVPS